MLLCKDAKVEGLVEHVQDGGRTQKVNTLGACWERPFFEKIKRVPHFGKF